MKSRLLFTLLLALVLGISCNKEQKDQPILLKLKPVRLAYVPYSSSLPVLVASENSYFKKAGLLVELVRFETSNESIIALLKGDIDGIMGIGLTSLLAIELKSPRLFKMIWYAVESDEAYVNAILVPNNSDAKKIEDLRNKTVGTYTGATQLFNLRAIFKAALGDADAVKISQVSPTLQLQVLVNGDVAALFTIEPFLSLALSRKIGRVLVANPRCKYILKPFPAGGGVLATEFLNNRTEDANRVVESLDEAIKFIRSNETASKALLPKYTPLKPEIASQSFLYGWWTSYEVDLSALQKVIDLFVNEKIISGSVEANVISMVRK